MRAKINNKVIEFDEFVKNSDTVSIIGKGYRYDSISPLILDSYDEILDKLLKNGYIELSGYWRRYY